MQLIFEDVYGYGVKDHAVAEFEYKDRKFWVWNNGCYFAMMNKTKNKEYFSERWFVIKELVALYKNATKLVATEDP